MPGKNNLQPAEASFIKTYKAELVLLFTTVTWGLSFPLIKLSLQYISPVFFIFLRFFITTVVFYLVFGRKFKLRNFQQWKNGVILGVFLFIGFALQNIGLKYTTATKSAFITGTSLVVIPFAQYFIIKKKPRPENIFGGIVVMTGLYILSGTYFTLPNTGDIFTFICAIAFALHVVLLDKYSRKDNFYYLVFGQFLTMVILSFIFMIVFEELIFKSFYININADLIFLLFYTSIISTLISIILMTKYQRLTTPLRAGIIYNMESVFAVIFAYILLNEILNFSQIIGASIMITGLLISEFYGFFRLKFSNENKS